MSFIELHLNKQRNPELATEPVIVNTRYIIKVEWKQTIDKDGGAIVTLSEGDPLHVVESYKSLKKTLKA
jgi:hypothetical protein